MNPKVDFYFEKGNRVKETELLRKIALSCGLEEKLKWGCPCYVYNNNNIVLIHTFNQYCAYLFFKGALLNDAKGILVQQTKNVQSARQVRFTHAKEIVKLEKTLKEYIYEAIEVEKAGLKVKMKKVEAYPVPKEFQQRLKKNAALKKAFNALTPGRQRGYLLHFAAAKQTQTRELRIDKATPAIIGGKGLTDK